MVRTKKPKIVSMLSKNSTVGRKTKYTKDIAEKAYKLSLLGCIDKEMIEFFGIVEQTWYNWQQRHPALVEAIRKGKTDANSEVAYALFHKATGYSHPDTYIFSKTVKKYDKDGKVIKSYTAPVTLPITKYYPPDTTAGIFWLKNRTRKSAVPWLEIARTELTGKDGSQLHATPKSDIDLSELTDAELELMENVGTKLRLVQGGSKTGTED